MNHVIDGQNRCKAAGTEAGDGLKREDTVGIGLASAGKAKIFINRIVDRLGLAHVTSRTVADLDDVL